MGPKVQCHETEYRNCLNKLVAIGYFLDHSANFIILTRRRCVVTVVMVVAGGCVLPRLT